MQLLQRPCRRYKHLPALCDHLLEVLWRDDTVNTGSENDIVGRGEDRDRVCSNKGEVSVGKEVASGIKKRKERDDREEIEEQEDAPARSWETSR